MDKFQQQTGIPKSPEGILKEKVRMLKSLEEQYRTLIKELCPTSSERHRSILDLQSARMFAVDSLFK